ncbi:MAG: TRAM domain-containing protein, partial [Candidatus Gastranaerophilales bacterium]|nr:TRAM domain-containing protein [Candidatus Gastranaerophilales bacterium]
MIIGEEFVVKIEKMLNDGNAIARINNIPVFIKGACPNDTVKVEINKINKNYVSACIKEIVEKSPSRISPFCSLHNVCGSCSWQYIDYDEQLRQKQQIVEETLEKIAGLKINVNTIIPSPKIKNCRCKIQLPVSQTKVSKRLLSGYYKINSHELINIKNCPMQPEIINEINEFIKEQALNLTISGYNEKFHTGLIRHIIYRISSDLNQILIVFVINSNMIDDKLKKLSDVLTDKYPSVKGICANYNTKRTNVIMSQNTKIIKGQD